MRLLLPSAGLLVAMILGMSPAFADAQYDACVAKADGVMMEIGACGGDWMEREDKRLNEAWRELMALASAAAKPKLLAEQRAWLGYRDASCDYWSDEIEYGQIGRYLNWPSCRAKIVAQRTQNLEDTAEAMQPQ